MSVIPDARLFHLSGEFLQNHWPRAPCLLPAGPMGDASTGLNFQVVHETLNHMAPQDKGAKHPRVVAETTVRIDLPIIASRDFVLITATENTTFCFKSKGRKLCMFFQSVRTLRAKSSWHFCDRARAFTTSTEWNLSIRPVCSKFVLHRCYIFCGYGHTGSRTERRHRFP